MSSTRIALLCCTIAWPSSCACGDDAGDTTNGDAAAAGAGGGDRDAASPGDTDRDLAACFADLGADGGLFVEVQSFETEDGAIRIRRARRPGSRMAVGETFAYDLVRFGVESARETHCEERPSRLAYDFGHHNWNERWEARTDRARYVVTEALDVTRLGATPEPDDLWTDTLEVYAVDGDERLSGPHALVPGGCSTLPYDLNPCFKRMRTDQPPAGGQQ